CSRAPASSSKPFATSNRTNWEWRRIGSSPWDSTGSTKLITPQSARSRPSTATSSNASAECPAWNRLPPRPPFPSASPPPSAPPPFPGVVPSGIGGPLEIQGRPADVANKPVADQFTVEPHYFETLRIPLLQGRGFMDSDDESRPRVAIVNASLAARFWPGQNP